MRLETREILDRALQLPAGEKADLIDALLVALDKPDGAIDALWRTEVQDRLAAYTAGTLRAVSLDDVLAKYRRE